MGDDVRMDKIMRTDYVKDCEEKQKTKGHAMLNKKIQYIVKYIVYSTDYNQPVFLSIDGKTPLICVSCGLNELMRKSNSVPSVGGRRQKETQKVHRLNYHNNRPFI